jgi:hypothetical protein
MRLALTIINVENSHKLKEDRMKKVFIAFITFLLILINTMAFAESSKTEAIVGDALVIRPAGLVAIVTGTAIFVVSLPFAVITRDVPKTSKKLIADPFNYTFHRPLGDFKYETATTDQ